MIYLRKEHLERTLDPMKYNLHYHVVTPKKDVYANQICTHITDVYAKPGEVVEIQCPACGTPLYFKYEHKYDKAYVRCCCCGAYTHIRNLRGKGESSPDYSCMSPLKRVYSDLKRIFHSDAKSWVPSDNLSHNSTSQPDCTPTFNRTDWPKGIIRIKGTSKTCQLSEGKNIIGRKDPASRANIQIDTATSNLSLEQIVIEGIPSKNGLLYVVSLCESAVKSRTFVGHSWLQYGKKVRLEHGMEISLPGIEVVFELPDYKEIPKTESYSISETQSTQNPVQEDVQKVNSCVYAPTDVVRDDYMITQVYLYLDNESDIVRVKAKSVDETAELRQYKPLQIPIKVGDKVTVQLKMRGAEIDDYEKKDFIWKGSFIGCEFAVYVPKEYPRGTLLGTVNIFINDFPAGEMLFKTNVVGRKTLDTFTKVEAKRFDKVFVSYSHKDQEVVRTIVEGLRIVNSDYFYDRHTLKGGDKFREVIKDWIENSDVFVLCWSENAAQSVEVEKEKNLALEVISKPDSHLRMYPLSIEPKALLPKDMINIYNFSQLHP